MSIGFLKKFKKKRKNFTISAPHCGWRRKKRGGRIIKKRYKRAGSLFFDRKTSAACRRRAARALIRFPPAAPPRKNAAEGFAPRPKSAPRSKKRLCAALGGADRTFIYCAVSAPRSAYSRPIILRPPPVPFFRSGPDAPPRGRARFLRGKARARG